MKRVSQSLKQLDHFGEGVKFTVKGQEAYKTLLGATITLLIYLVVIVYGSNKFTKLYQRQDTSFQQVTLESSIDVEQRFSMKELEANFAFTLFSNQFVPSVLVAQSMNATMDDYVQIEASLWNAKFNKDENQVVRKETKLPMHPCNSSDKFFKPIDSLADGLPFVLQTALCFDDLEDIEIWGNYRSQSTQAIVVRLVRCSNRPTCKTSEDIDKFVNNNGNFWMVRNDQSYNSDQYGDETISRRSKFSSNVINSNSKEFQSYEFQRQSLESEERYLGDGFSPHEEQFVSFQKSTRVPDGFNQESFGGFLIEMSLDEVAHQRSIYSLLDFLGDVGGLYSILLDIGTILTSVPGLFCGSTLYTFLASAIFKTRRLGASPPVSVFGFSSFQKKRSKQIVEKAREAIEKELDIVKFVKKQLKITIALEALFSKAERLLITKNRRFYLENSDSDQKWGANDTRQLMAEHQISRQTKVLLDGAQPSHQKVRKKISQNQGSAVNDITGDFQDNSPSKVSPQTIPHQVVRLKTKTEYPSIASIK